jgi:hypothetical protein
MAPIVEKSWQHNGSNPNQNHFLGELKLRYDVQTHFCTSCALLGFYVKSPCGI